MWLGRPTVDDNNPAGGATFTLSTTVQNAGDGAAAATTRRYFRSTDATITTDDTAEGSVAVEELSPSGNTSASVQLTAPGTGGTYYYGACVDAVTDESNTANNCSSSVQVTVREPDEGVSHCTGSPTSQGECSLWINPNVITASDPSWLRSVEYVGRGERELWGFISYGWVARNAYLFDVQYGARQGVTEFQLHPEYGSREAAQEQVDVYAPMLGRLPLVLLSNVREVEVQIASADPTPAGAYERLGIIHINTYQAETTVLEGFMEEILLHEGAHASLDGDHARSPNWRAAQDADGRFLNSYARDYPEREDIAETTWAYFVTHYRPDRIGARNVETISGGDSESVGLFRRAAIRHVSLCASRNVTVDTTGGTPTLALTLGGTQQRRARYASGSGTDALVFAYTLSKRYETHPSMGVVPDSLAGACAGRC